MSDKPQTIFKTHRDKDFMTINLSCINDKRASLKAKGLHALMMAQKDDWIFFLEELATRSKDGIKAVRSGFKELQELGYVERYPEKEKGRIVRWVINVYETPQERLKNLCKPCGQKAPTRSPFCTSRNSTSGKGHTNKNNNNQINLNQNNNVEESQNVEIIHNTAFKSLSTAAKRRLIDPESLPRLLNEVIAHVLARPAHMSIQHSVNAACKLIREGKWSTPKQMMYKEIETRETRYEHEKLKERQECANSQIGRFLADAMRA